MKMLPGFVEDARNFYKWGSVQLFILLGSLSEITVWIAGFQDYIDRNLFHHMMTAICVLGILYRVIKQGQKGDSNGTTH